MNPLTASYQELYALIRARLVALVEQQWNLLGGYDEGDVSAFVDAVVPLVLAAQTEAVNLTDAYLSAFIGAVEVGLDPAELTGAAVRNGTELEEVYRRPFVNVWTALAGGALFVDAVNAGRARALASADMDVALSTRAAARAYGQGDNPIVGFQRVPDGGACQFCTLVAGQRYTTGDLMPVHNRCGCTVEPITRDERHRFTGKAENDLDVTRNGVTAAVEQHGELGPVLVDGSDKFTKL